MFVGMLFYAADSRKENKFAHSSESTKTDDKLSFEIKKQFTFRHFFVSF